MGTPEFARRPLLDLAQSHHDLVGVVTGRDKPAGRGRRILSTPVKIEAERLGVPVFTPNTLKSRALHEALAELHPDLFVVIAFRILPESLFSLPRLGSVNIHGSLLPKYRGAAPINWALINGETETGLSSFLLKRDVDTGDVIAQERTEILDSDTFDSLYARMSEMAGPFLLKTLALIESGEAAPVAQDDSLACGAPKLTPQDGFIDFGFPATNVRNFIRGLSSKPGAWSTFRGKTVRILACEIADVVAPTGTRPGSTLADRKRLLIACAQSAIEVVRIVPEGKKSMDGPSFINGFRPEAGELFGQPVMKD
ncbi:methionyl-tRNA formyltransferase [bacterium]|nr:methionyl-tRNA formyltransferase [bacterium]